MFMFLYVTFLIWLNKSIMNDIGWIYKSNVEAILTIKITSYISLCICCIRMIIYSALNELLNVTAKKKHNKIYTCLKYPSFIHSVDLLFTESIFVYVYCTFNTLSQTKSFVGVWTRCYMLPIYIIKTSDRTFVSMLVLTTDYVVILSNGKCFIFYHGKSLNKQSVEHDYTCISVAPIVSRLHELKSNKFYLHTYTSNWLYVMYSNTKLQCSLKCVSPSNRWLNFALPDQLKINNNSILCGFFLAVSHLVQRSIEHGTDSNCRV